MSEKRFRLLLAGVVLLGFVLRVFWIQSQPVSDDDYLVGVTAHHYVEDGQTGPTMWNHPGLRNLLVYASLSLLGNGVLGLKGWNLVFGVLSIPLLGSVARKLTRSETAGLVAAFLWAMDPVAINYSRQAINDIYMAFFPVAGIWLALKYRAAGSPLLLALSGACFGLGLASKWSAMFQLAPTGVLVLVSLLRGRARHQIPGLPGRLFLITASYVVLPLTLYALTFYPWFGRGYSLAEWMDFQKAMLMETSQHTGYTADRTAPGRIGDHKPREWFIRPVNHNDIFYVIRNPGEARVEATLEENMVILVSWGNPLVWLLVLPGMGYVLYQGGRRRDENLVYLSALFLCAYLPVVIAKRPIWVNTAVYVMPYALSGVAFMVTGLLRFVHGKRLLAGYLLAVLFVTIPLYIGVIGEGLRTPYMGDYLKQKFFSESGYEGRGVRHSVPGEGLP